MNMFTDTKRQWQMISYFYRWRKYSQQKSCKNGKAKHLQSKVNCLEKKHLQRKEQQENWKILSQKTLDTAIEYVVYDSVRLLTRVHPWRRPKPQRRDFLTRTFCRRVSCKTVKTKGTVWLRGAARQAEQLSLGAADDDWIAASKAITLQTENGKCETRPRACRSTHS